MVRTVAGLDVPEIVVEDEDGTFIRQSPSELGIKESIVHSMGPVDVYPVKAEGFVLGRLLKEYHQTGNAKLLDHPKRATCEGEVVEDFS